jgi:hypothetical protein
MSEPKKVKPVWMGVVMTLCHWCAHRDQDSPWRCKAYPEEIPQEVVWMNVDHRQPYVDDHGVRFELREDMTPFDYAFFLRDYFAGGMEAEKPAYEARVAKIMKKRRIPLSMLEEALPKRPA